MLNAVQHRRGMHRTAGSSHLIAVALSGPAVNRQVCRHIDADMPASAARGVKPLCMNVDTQLNASLLAVLVCHQVFIAAWLLLVPQRRHAAAVVLGIFLLIDASCDLLDILHCFALLQLQPWAAAFSLPWTYALAPLLYGYAFALTSADGALPLRRLAWLSFGPVAAALCVVPYLLLPAAHQLWILEGGHEPAPSGIDPNAALWPLKLAIVGFPIYAAAHLCACWARLRRHLRRTENVFSHIEDKTLSWLRWTLLVLSAAVALSVVETAAELLLDRPLYGDLASNLLKLAWIYPMTILALLQPTAATHMQESSDIEATEAAPTPSVRYARSALTETDAQRIAAKLDDAMRETRMYRDTALTLRHLSDHTGVTPAYLSQTFNTHLGCSFFDYVNRWRIEDACHQLADPARSIVKISEDVGFRSRSTFNAAFKKAIGQTPTAYRQRMLEPDAA